MKNRKNTIAKLLAEEDIFVIHKQMETAYFDIKNRELGLPIWKENTMEEVEEELLVCHEIGHALYTPLDMMENAHLRKIEHSVVNVLEDARIEKKVMNKYLGTVRVFKSGYESLIKKDFFGTSTKDVSKFNLIDRINLHFKNNVDVPFAANETIWVDKAGKTETPDDVLDLAEELIAWMAENPESMGDPDESGDADSEAMGNPIDGSGESGSGESGESGDMEKIANELADALENGSSEELSEKLEKFKNEMEKAEDGSKSDDGDNGDADGDSSDGENSDGSETGDGEELKVPEASDVTEGGKDGKGAGAMPNITAETAEKFGKSLENARDKDAEGYSYVRINDLDLKKIVVPYKSVIEETEKHYGKSTTDLFYTSTLEKINEKKKSAKKTVAYMVKEFEMKKSADAYSRAAVSKTGSLDMGKLHTYKYNEDLFKKVTTLPGATNHGLVMCLDWSGSMADNLPDTLTQLYNLIWFCRRTKIPFEVFAFSDHYARNNGIESDQEVGAFDVRNFAMLNFFSSKMTTDEEMKMMHYLWMIANRWGYRDWNIEGFPLGAPRGYDLGGTPLNEAIIAMMKIVPKFKSDNNLQKVHSVFLTDGAGSSLNTKTEWLLDTYERSPNYGEHYLGVSKLEGKVVITDPVTNKTITSEDRYMNCTPILLELLKNRVPDMNVVGFFIAGSGRKGKVKADTLRYAVDGWQYEYGKSDKILAALKELKKNNVFVAKSKGYDEYYILPGSMKTEEFELSDDLVGASKAKLKSAFGKSVGSRISSRPLLNKFVSMVA